MSDSSEILSHLTEHEKALARAVAWALTAEAALANLDPQIVVACQVPGYTDPPERVALAQRDKAAGIVSVPSKEDAKAIAEGRMAAPPIAGATYHIFDLKRAVVNTRQAIAAMKHRVSLLESDLSQAKESVS